MNLLPLWQDCFSLSMIKVVQAGSIAKIILNRPEVHNAFNPEFIGEIQKAFEYLQNHESIRVAILTGEGKSFCAGADLNWMKRMNQYTAQENLEDSLYLARLFQQLDEFPKPLIGQINGIAMGGGVGLVAICDIVLTLDLAKFAFSEVRIGLIPAVISPYIVRKIGYSHTRHLMISGEAFSAEKARQIGLVHELCPREELDIRAYEVAQLLLANGPKAMSHAKQLLREIVPLGEDLITITAAAIAERRIHPEGQEGIQALLEKRKPSFAIQDPS